MSADSIRVKSGGIEISHLRVVGAIPGVRIDQAGGANGPGVGGVRYDEQGLAWRPPGAEYGSPVAIPGDGAYLLAGPEPGQFARVTAWESYLRIGAEESVYLADRFANGPPGDDVTAEEAEAGDVATWTLSLVNESALNASDLRVWLDGDTDRIEISDNGSNWSSPTTEETAIQFGDVTAGDFKTLHVRRTVEPVADYDPAVLVRLHMAFTCV